MLTTLSEALFLPEPQEGFRERNVEFEATLPDVRIDCLLFLSPAERETSQQGALKGLGTINVLHIKAPGDKFTEKQLQTYLGQALIINGSEKVGEAESVLLVILCSERPRGILESKIFRFKLNASEPYVYENESDWFFPVRIFILNDIPLTDENLPLYFPFVPFITAREKFLEFFPKIGHLEISTAWEFFCDLFASRANPLYEEVRKMILQLSAEDIQHALQYVPKDEMPEVINRLIRSSQPGTISEIIRSTLKSMPSEKRDQFKAEILKALEDGSFP
ncbi:hypothetical protein HYR99_25600 [Candidatus Poribacteria bacterium]|nr:hypothetical protein [Candidatus Poribacteria bacterium]